MKTKNIRFTNEGKANNVNCENSSIPQRELTLMWKSSGQTSCPELYTQSLCYSESVVSLCSARNNFFFVCCWHKHIAALSNRDETQKGTMRFKGG